MNSVTVDRTVMALHLEWSRSETWDQSCISIIRTVQSAFRMALPTLLVVRISTLRISAG